jgi:AraC-like DNA-binding protein
MLARVEEYHLTPAKPFHGGIVEHDYPAPLGTDMHQAFELGVLLSGHEERHFEDTVVSVQPGDIWLCGAWEPHGWRARTTGTRELVLQFLPDFLGEEVFEGMSWLSFFSAPPEHRPRLTCPETRVSALTIAEELRSEMRERRRGWLAAVRLGLLRLLLLVSREWSPARQPSKSLTIRTGNLGKIMPAVRLVHSHPTRRVSLKEAAATCGLSVSQFGYLFRHLMGLSFGKFCMRARLAYVAQLLLTTDLSVEAIADAARFSDASHLHHAFVAVYGATPARYRKQGQRVPGERAYQLIETVGVEDYGAVRAGDSNRARPHSSRERAQPDRGYAEIETVGPEQYGVSGD